MVAIKVMLKGKSLFPPVSPGREERLRKGINNT